MAAYNRHFRISAKQHLTHAQAHNYGNEKGALIRPEKDEISTGTPKDTVMQPHMMANMKK
jgi:hypothetical protein